MENGIIPLSNGALSEGLSGEEESRLQLYLWRLLAARTALYTAGESSSVRTETAQELLKSICFCLELYFRRSGKSRKLLLSGDPDALFLLAQKAVAEQTEIGKRLYSAACAGAPDFGNIAYRDTLREIGGFFRRYDSRFFAHDIPCDIDYPLCRALGDEFLGIEFINEYLRRIIIENDFVHRFDKGTAVGLLESYCRDYRGLLINLYEPLAVNAVGLSLAGESVLKLRMTEKDRTRLEKLFGTLSATPAKRALAEAAAGVCAGLGIRDKAAARYLRETAEGLYPRIEAALPHGGLGGIFL